MVLVFIKLQKKKKITTPKKTLKIILNKIERIVNPNYQLKILEERSKKDLKV